jgi:hypothetical protein
LVLDGRSPRGGVQPHAANSGLSRHHHLRATLHRVHYDSSMSDLDQRAVEQLARIQELQSENIPYAAWTILTSRRRFIAIFVEHRRRAHSVMQLMMSMPVRGLIADDTPKGVEVEATDALAAVRTSVIRGLGLSCAALLVALACGYWLGALSHVLPVHLGKCLQTAGGALALWGTLVALSGPDGVANSIPRRAHTLIFIVLLSIGGGLAMIGTLL